MLLVKNDPGCRRRLSRTLRLVFLSEDSPRSDYELWNESKYNLSLQNVMAAELVFWSRGTGRKFQKDSDTCLIDLTQKGFGYEDHILLRLPIRKGRYPMLRVRYVRPLFNQHSRIIGDSYNIVFPSLTPVFGDQGHARELPVKLSQFTVASHAPEKTGYNCMWQEFNCMDLLYPWDSKPDPSATAIS